jgi:hypothetical protein
VVVPSESVSRGQYGRDDYGDTLLACVNYLREHGMDVDEEMARLAIQIYTERNEACHTVGNPSIAGDTGQAYRPH